MATHFFPVKKKYKKYWGNPQVYITSAVEAAPHDAHFILYDFKTNELQPLDNDVKNIDIMGELRYKVIYACSYVRKII